MNVRPTLAGALTYTISCVAGSTTGSASATVTVTGAAAPPAGDGGGGGGSIGPVDLAFFVTLGLVGYWQRRRESSRH